MDTRSQWLLTSVQSPKVDTWLALQVTYINNFKFNKLNLTITTNRAGSRIVTLLPRILQLGRRQRRRTTERARRSRRTDRYGLNPFPAPECRASYKFNSNGFSPVWLALIRRQRAWWTSWTNLTRCLSLLRTTLLGRRSCKVPGTCQNHWHQVNTE